MCLLVLTIDDLPYERLWREWAQTGPTRSPSSPTDRTATTTPSVMVSMVVHAKYPERVTSPWLKQRLLVQPPRVGRGHSYADPEYLSHVPEWGSIQLTRAMIDLLVHAMTIGKQRRNNDKKEKDEDENKEEKDPRFSTQRYRMESSSSSSDDHDGSNTHHIPSDMPPVDTFIFISESCVPVKSLREVAHELYVDQVNQHTLTTTMTVTTNGSATTGSAGSVAAATTAPSGELLTSNDDGSGGSGADVGSTTTTKGTLAPWHVSWVNARNRHTPGTPKNKYERDQFAEIHRIIPQSCRYKADQFVLLSRPHAQAVLDIDRHLRPREQLWNCFASISASDEMYFPTALAIVGILKDDHQVDDCQKNANGGGDNDIHQSTATSHPHPPQVLRRQVTYVDWTEGMRHPASFTKGMKDFKRIARIARKQGSLFARKFLPSWDIPGQERVITGQIDPMEWRQEIEIMEREDNAAAAAAAARSEHKTTEMTTTTATLKSNALAMENEKCEG